MIKKLFVIALTLGMLSACKSNTQGFMDGGSWLDGNMSSTMGDQTNALYVVYFPYDSSSVGEKGSEKLKEQAEMWIASSNRAVLVVQGYCDERGTIDYNLALGERRAYAVKKELIKLGVPSDKIETISYGKERPAVMGDDASTWALNRRSVTIAVKN